jgi:hypothetical protein
VKKLGLILLGAVIAAPAATYDHPPGSHAIREAYFIGASNYPQGLAGYIKSLPVPNTGAHVAEMEVRTPFAQVIVMSHEHSVGYSAQQAAQDYRKNPDTIQVRVQILNTATFAIDSPAAAAQSACRGAQRMNSVQECFRGFRFQFSQGKEIKPKTSYGVPVDFYTGDGISGSIGGNIWFVFSTNDVASAPLRVTVYTPDGQEVSAEFDLAALR